MGVTRVDDADKVRDTVQIDSNIGGRRSPLTMNLRTPQKVNPVQNAAGVVITISNKNTNNSSQSNLSLSNIDMNLFAAD